MDDRGLFGDLQRWPWNGLPGLQVPVLLHDFSVFALVCTALHAPVRDLLPLRLRPVPAGPGRCLVVLAAVEYRHTDLGPYNELVVAFPVQEGAQPRAAWGLLTDAMRRSFRAWIWQMPVTTARARDAGVALAAYPKWVTSIDIRREQGRASCRVDDGGQGDLRMECSWAASSRRRELSLRAYTTSGAHLLVSSMQAWEAGHLDRLRDDTARIQFGTGALSRSLLELGVGARPLGVHVCNQGSALLSAPRNAVETRGGGEG
ncbi:MAG TPA: acetoacetate decarboxylase family protein [Burkholderiaceae bacterium]|nr:acetoacetate decarboxylase family protein [Burkholderiaceae bacterium]